MPRSGEPFEPTALTPVTVEDRPTLGAAIEGGSPAAPIPLIPAPRLPPGTTVGRYVILDQLGEGGMGVVYVAHDPELDRKVALKLVRAEVIVGESSEGRDRLVREAHAMARLNHPNVVAIHDAGVFEHAVFLAVELVDGSDVWAWITAGPRTWREVIGVFTKAGRGLAAAHAAGLVHRDFKPENVLISKTGDVKVTDFGLARTAGNAAAAQAPKAGLVPPSHESLSKPLTRAGVVSGTPGYIAPEQLVGFPGDARSDEFSFCVALYEALYKEQPFATQVMPQGDHTLRPPPPDTQVPGWIRKILLRGLSIDPQQRYPSIDALLDALANDPAIRRRRVLTLVGVAALVVVGAGTAVLFVQHRRTLADACYKPEAKLAGIWDPATRERVLAAFTATGAPDATVTAEYAEKALDRASTAWLGAYRDACQATRIAHAQSETALRLRLDCLTNQRYDLKAASEIIQHPKAKDLTASIGAARTLPLPSECADAQSLSLVEPPQPEQRHDFAALRRKLAHGSALLGAGRAAEALETLKPLPEEAASVGAPTLQATALDSLGTAYATLHDYPHALETYVRADSAAEAAHMDQLAARTAASVARQKVQNGAPAAEVDAALARAQDNLRRAGGGGLAEYYVELAASVVSEFHGRFADAVAHGRRALQLSDQLFGDDSAGALTGLATDLAELGQDGESITLLKKAIADTDAILGPRNRRAANAQLSLTRLLLRRGRLDDAQQALDSLLGRLGSGEQVETAQALGLQALLQAQRGQRDDSLRTARKSLAMAEKLGLATSSSWDDIPADVVEADLRDHKPKVALEVYAQHLAAKNGFDDLGGWAALDAGQPKQALPLLERALGAAASQSHDTGRTAGLRLHLAQALVATRGDRKRAQALAQQAHDELAHLEAPGALLAEVDAWRAKAFRTR